MIIINVILRFYILQSLILNGQDRDLLKKLIKNMKLSLENYKKMRAKEQKDREKLEKQQAKKKTLR